MGDGPAAATVHDVTVTTRAQRFAVVEAAVSRGLADADGGTRAADRVVQVLGVSMGWTVVEVWLVDDARQVVVCAARFTIRDVTDLCLRAAPTFCVRGARGIQARG